MNIMPANYCRTRGTTSLSAARCNGHSPFSDRMSVTTLLQRPGASWSVAVQLLYSTCCLSAVMSVRKSSKADLVFSIPQNAVLHNHPWKLTFNAVLRVGNGCVATTLVVISSGYAPSLHFPQPTSASFPQTFAPFTEQVSRHKWIALSHFEDADQ